MLKKKGKYNSYIVLKCFADAVSGIENTLIAKSVVTPSKVAKMPRHTTKLDFFEERLATSNLNSKLKEDLLTIIKYLKKRRCQLAYMWCYVIQNFLNEFERLDPTSSLLDKAFQKIEQAIDGFKGNISMLKRRLKKDMIRLKQGYLKVSIYYFSSYMDNQNNSTYEEYFYNNVSSTDNFLISNNYIMQCNPELICMAKGL